jgi:hypothetical protein
MVKQWGRWVMATLCRRWSIAAPDVLEFVAKAPGPGEFVVYASETPCRGFMKPCGGRGQIFVNVDQSTYEQLVTVGHETHHWWYYLRGYDEPTGLETQADFLGRALADEVTRRGIWLPQ